MPNPQQQNNSQSTEIPASPEIEWAVLAQICQHPDYAVPIFTQTAALDLFYNPVNRELATVALFFFSEHRPLDQVSLCHHLIEAKRLDALGGPFQVSQLWSEVSSTEAFSYHLEILHDKYVLRQILAQASDLQRKAATPGADPEAILAELKTKTDSLSVRRKSSLSIRRFRELMQMTFDDLDNYFGDRILAAGQPCTLLGPGGIGKSRLSMQMAICMITGRDFLGMPTRAQNKKWLFIQTENSNRRLSFDLVNIARALNLTNEELDLLEQNLYIHTLENDLDALLNLAHPESYNACARLISDINPDFVQFDPLNSLTDADLNSDMDMRWLVRAISQVTQNGRTDRTPLVLHHSLTGKAGAQRAVGWDKASYGRNSKVLQAWTRAQINLSPRSADDPNLLLLSCGKNNNGKMFPEIGVAFNPDSGIYLHDKDFNPNQFREDIGLEKRTTPIQPEEVRDLCADGIPSARLAEILTNRFAVSRATAYRAIEKARSTNLIREEMTNFKLSYFRS